MKQYFIKSLFAGLIAFATVPVMAQKEKDKEKEKEEKKEIENIIITRRGDLDEKTVIEIDGDKIKINGKDAKDLKDGNVTVNRNKIKDYGALARTFNRNGQNWNFNFDSEGMSLFSEDENRAMLGVVTDDNEDGAEIRSVSKESAAEKAGLKAGDVITKIGNKKIEDAGDVAEAVRSHKPGDKVDITILRNGKQQKLTAELSKWKGIRMNTMPPTVVTPEAFGEAPGMEAQPFRSYVYGSSPKLGLSVQDTDDGKGVKVLEVDEGSNAAKAGIQKGDIITHVDDDAVNSTDEISQYIRTHRNQQTVRLQVLRNGKTEKIEVRLRKPKTADL